MLLDTISASFNVSARLYSNTPGISGSIQTNISRNLADLNLDALFTQVIPAADLVSTSMVFDDFPTVELDGVAAYGDDKQPLTINSIHGICIQILADKDADGVDLPKAGEVTVTLAQIGNPSGSPAVRKMVAGDDFLNTTVLGWPGVTASTLTIAGNADLADCSVVIALFGSSAGTAGGYGS